MTKKGDPFDLEGLCIDPNDPTLAQKGDLDAVPVPSAERARAASANSSRYL
jgi:hypothetical protein